MKSLKVLLIFIFAVLAIPWFAEPTYAATITAPTSISVDTTWTSDNIYLIPTYTVV
jgi:hypothetical protein